MSCRNAVYQWNTSVATHVPQLSTPQAAVLALWSLGRVLARSCALSAVATFWAVGLERKPHTVRQQLREWCYEAAAKQGEHRQEVRVESCFAPLLAWVLRWWEGQQLALALDATALGARFVVLAVSVVYRGCAIPVAWAVLPANQKHTWRGEWLRMLRQLRPAVPTRMTVIVLADRGLSARWLYRRIVRWGWHPVLRINGGGTFRPQVANRFQPLKHFAPQPGTRWQGRGTAAKPPSTTNTSRRSGSHRRPCFSICRTQSTLGLCRPCGALAFGQLSTVRNGNAQTRLAHGTGPKTIIAPHFIAIFKCP